MAVIAAGDRDLYTSFSTACEQALRAKAHSSSQELESSLNQLRVMIADAEGYECRTTMCDDFTSVVLSCSKANDGRFDRAALTELIKCAASWQIPSVCTATANLAISMLRDGKLLLHHAKMIVLGMNEICPCFGTKTAVADLERIMISSVNAECD